MNKIKLVLLSSLLLTTSSCSFSNSKYEPYCPISSNEPIKDISADSIEEESVLSYVEFEIHYRFENGEVFKIDKRKYADGHKFLIQSPDVQFMEPDLKNVSGYASSTMDKIIYVTYHYSYYGVRDIKKGEVFEDIIFNKNDGISFSCILAGGRNYGEVLFAGDSWRIANGRVILTNEKYNCEWFPESGILHGTNTWDTLITSSINEQIVLTVSINLDGTITYYKNGEKVITLLGSQFPNNYTEHIKQNHAPILKDLIGIIFNELEEKHSFRMGKDDDRKVIYSTINNVAINKACNEVIAKKIFDQYCQIKIKYVDKSTGNEIFDNSIYYGIEDENYSIVLPDIKNYKLDKTLIEGSFSKNKEIIVHATFEGEDRATEGIIYDHSNIANWGDSSKWLTIASDLEGDFSVITKEHMYGARNIDINPNVSNVGDVCWRTKLNIIHDAANIDNRWVSRLDWYGWQSGSIGIHPSYERWIDKTDFSYDFDLGLMFKDVVITTLYKRSGTTITIDSTLTWTANNKYKGTVVTYRAKLTGVTTSKINISISSEYSKSIYSSIK